MGVFLFFSIGLSIFVVGSGMLYLTYRHWKQENQKKTLSTKA